MAIVRGCAGRRLVQGLPWLTLYMDWSAENIPHAMALSALASPLAVLWDCIVRMEFIGNGFLETLLL